MQDVLDLITSRFPVQFDGAPTRHYAGVPHVTYRDGLEKQEGRMPVSVTDPMLSIEALLDQKRAAGFDLIVWRVRPHVENGAIRFRCVFLRKPR